MPGNVFFLHLPPFLHLFSQHKFFCLLALLVFIDMYSFFFKAILQSIMILALRYICEIRFDILAEHSKMWDTGSMPHVKLFMPTTL